LGILTAIEFMVSSLNDSRISDLKELIAGLSWIILPPTFREQCPTSEAAP
jgi:hypothetical protein